MRHVAYSLFTITFYRMFRGDSESLPGKNRNYGLTESRSAATSKLASNAVSTLVLPSVIPF